MIELWVYEDEEDWKYDGHRTKRIIFLVCGHSGRGINSLSLANLPVYIAQCNYLEDLP
ncbi:MAG: hypothetical protein AAB453_04160 [Patescibacteria group bacterium]